MVTELQKQLPDSERLPRLVGIQFRRAATIVHDYLAEDLDVPHGTRVVVDTEHGEALAWTVGEAGERQPHWEEGDGPLRRVLRVATAADLARETDLQGREHEALRHCALRARELGLDMKLVAAEWQHSGGRVVFYFSSEQRVDFRALVRELAQKYRSRVEMRQVGPRDEAKIIGAMGPCGRETCCSSWLRAFAPVTIKMAKDQGLALNPQKTMGVCGRLLCCLSYEQDTYTALRRALPKVGKQVGTPKGPGRVVDVFALRGSVRVALDSGGRWEEFPASELEAAGAPRFAVVKSPAAKQPAESVPAPSMSAPEPEAGKEKEKTDKVQSKARPGRRKSRPAGEPVKNKEPEAAKPAPKQKAPKPAQSKPKPKPDRVDNPVAGNSEKTESRHRRRRRRGRTGGEGGDANK